MDFQNSFTDAFCRQLAKKWLLNIPPHFNCGTVFLETWCTQKLPKNYENVIQVL